MEIAHRRTKNISEWKPLRTIINQSTRYHIVNSLVPCKMKVYRKLNNEATKRSHSNIAKRNGWINPLLPYKILKKNKIEERNMYRNKKVAAKAKIISRRADRVNLNNLYGLVPLAGRRWLFWPGRAYLWRWGITEAAVSRAFPVRSPRVQMGVR